MFDLLKIRRLIDEATNLAVRASGGIDTPKLTPVNGGAPSSHAELSQGTSGKGSKLSAQRKLQMLQLACQKLADAFRVDEMACSAAIIQIRFPFRNLGALVLKQKPDDADAHYVEHFLADVSRHAVFHVNSLEVPDLVIRERPSEPGV